MMQLNVFGEELQECGRDPVTGFYRDGCCTWGPQDVGSHTICAVMTAEFLEHQRSIGNDLSTPMPAYGFPGLVPGDRWCVTARNWARAHQDGQAAPVVVGIAVLAGIAASDAVCIAATGTSYSGEDHAEAARVLGRTDGPLGKELAKLVRLKPGAHYGSTFISADDCTRALRAAKKLVEAATSRTLQG